ncbi:MAG: glycosyltransferase family 2 protein [Eubacteriales bacterium]|nr:glycosyltransferase family 2 protein [Eubacteriales bacterium]
MDIVADLIEGTMTVMSGWLVILIVYNLGISFFGFKRDTKDYQDHDPQLRFLVLVPAHNEEAVIADIIQNLNKMEYPRELYDFYILADNCTDHTADVARGLNANVLESHRETPDAPTGKPIVLEKALKELAGYQNKYDLVMFFDADNLIDTNMFAEVNSQYLDSDGQVDIIQCYLGSKNRKGIVALFYFMTYTITNRFFQYAKSRLGINSVIGGTGFAVSADYLYRRGGWTAMSLTEDFELQIEATCEGKRILWNHNARIYDEKPTAFRASYRQRTRWAQGHWFVTFKNTGKLFRALGQKKISLKEFVSTFLYMYSLTPYVVLMLQLVFGLMMLVFQWTGLIQTVPTHASPSSWLVMNWPSIVLFFYSFIFLFYIGDHMDNHNRFDYKVFFPMLLSVLLNTVLAGWAQVVGLFKHRKQSNWVKTEHKINRSEDMVVSIVNSDQVNAEAEALIADVGARENVAQERESVGV